MPKKRTWTEKPAGKGKVNPNSLTKLLIDVRQEVFREKGLIPFAERLTKAGNFYADNLVTSRRVAGIEENETQVRYIDVEKYAHCLGVPTGLLLLYSRMIANETTIRDEDNVELAARLVAIFSGIGPDTKFLVRVPGRKEPVVNMSELNRWRKQWPAQPGGQSPLPLTPPSAKRSTR
jgi:hypothetical protein